MLPGAPGQKRRWQYWLPSTWDHWRGGGRLFVLEHGLVYGFVLCWPWRSPCWALSARSLAGLGAVAATGAGADHCTILLEATHSPYRAYEVWAETSVHGVLSGGSTYMPLLENPLHTVTNKARCRIWHCLRDGAFIWNALAYAMIS